MRRILALAVMLLLMLSLGKPAMADPASTRTVTGLVTGAHGAPVGGAQVELIQLGLGTVAVGATTPEGTYMLALAKVVPGPVYMVRAWAKGYTLGQSGWSDLNRSPAVDVSVAPATARIGGRVQDGQGMQVAGAAVELLAGTTVLASQVTDADGTYGFADQAMGTYRVRVLAKGFTPALSAATAAPGGQFTPVDVTLAVTTGIFAGQVVDQVTGLPLTGAHLLVQRQGAGIVATGDTGADGRFAFTLVAAGDAVYKLIAWAEGHSVQQTALTALPAGSQVRWQGASSLQLSPATGSLGLWLLDMNNITKSGAKVQLDRQGYGTVATALSDAKGHVQFDGVRAGSNYRLRIFPLSGSDQSAQTDWVPVTPGGLSEFSLTLTNPNANTFGNGIATGRVTDAGGRPVAGATVDVIRSAGGAMNTVTTDEDGRYSLQVPASKGDSWQTAPGYLLRVSKSGYTTTDQFSVPSGRTPPTNGLLDVPRSGVAVANVTLLPLTEWASGYVADAKGQPLEGVQVHVWQQGDAAAATDVTTDALGRYRVSLAQPDTPYLIWASGAGYLGATADSGPVQSANIALATLPNITLTGSGASLTVRVMDSLGRVPAKGTTVKAFVPTSGEWVSTRADTTGRAELKGLPVDGQSLAVSVSGEGYSTQAIYPIGSLTPQALLTLQPSPGDNSRTTATLPAQTGNLGGGVFADNGAPLVGATVSLLQEGVGVVATTQTDGAGHYSFTNLPAGPGARYVVRVEAAGYVSSSLLRTGKLLNPTALDAGGTIRMDVGLNAAP